MSRIDKRYSFAMVVGLAIGISLAGQAQTIIGMGTENPNPNAVLELVPENSNQGFLAPRLTSAQRTASSFTNKLTDADNGLLVFDTEQGTFFYWYGGKWHRGISDGQGGTGSDPVNHGTTWFTGTAAPNNIQASEGDFYINETSGEVYKFSNGSFGVIGNLGTSSGSPPDLPTSQLFVGNTSNQATPVTITGDITIAADGTVTITNASINTAKIANDAVD